jgi:hypothetical protein
LLSRVTGTWQLAHWAHYEGVNREGRAIDKNMSTSCSPRNYSTPESLCYSEVAVEWCQDWTKIGLNGGGNGY